MRSADLLATAVALGLLLLSAAAPALAFLPPPLGRALPGIERHNVLELFPPGQLVDATALHRGISLTYNTSELRRSGDWVEVSWEGVPDPQDTDLLAVYSPPDAFAHGASPIKFANCSEAPHHVARGSGTLALRLVNVRADWRVVFVRLAPDGEPLLSAAGPVLRNAAPNEPTGVHLLASGSHTGVLVQWTTRDRGRPMARYGTAPEALDREAPAATATYGANDLAGPPASTLGFVDPGLLHTAVLSGLQPGRRYWYIVGDAESGIFSAVHSFRGPPQPGAADTVHLLAVADQGVGEVDGSYAVMECQPTADVAALLAKEGATGPPGGGAYSLVLHPGDLAYARGYGALWDAWLLQQQPLAARVPYAVAIGNHERDVLEDGGIPYRTVDSGGEGGVPFGARFPLPTPTPGAVDQPWYAFDHGPIHFTVMSTEHYFTPASPQYAWLQADLAAVDRAHTPWLVLVGHRPMYIDADDGAWEQGKQTTALQLQAALEGLLGRTGVDLALSGHHHSYQRSCSVFAGQCHAGRAKGTVHVCVGNGGADFYDNGFARRPVWVEHEAQTTHGYARIHANRTHLHLEAVDATGQVYDEALLEAQRAPLATTSERATLFGKRVAALAQA